MKHLPRLILPFLVVAMALGCDDTSSATDDTDLDSGARIDSGTQTPTDAGTDAGQPPEYSAKAITSLAIYPEGSFYGVIDEAAKTVVVTLPFGTVVSSLGVPFLEHTGASAFWPDLGGNWDWSRPNRVQITAYDGSVAEYTVSVVIGGNQNVDITFVSFRNNSSDYAWYFANSKNADDLTQTRPVGTKLANELQLFDMFGSAFEWTWDNALVGPPPPIPDGPLTDFRGDATWSNNHVIIGGALAFALQDSIGKARYAQPTVAANQGSFGFRVVRN